MDEAFFQEHYEADGANKARQSFAQHMAWVRVFYEGKRFPPVPGWRKREEDLLRHHAPPVGQADAPPHGVHHARHELRHALHETGRVLASEWAKDNATRKVTTNDLQSWGQAFEGVARDASALLAALQGVQAEVKRRLG